MRLALIQFNPTVGDIRGNAERMAAWLERARGAGADLVAFPELSLCGYPPRDLLLEEGFVGACSGAVRELGEGHTAGITAVFGLPLPADGDDPASGRIANALVVYRDGRMVDYYDKRLLPTYDVFDEDRYFTPGRRAVVIEVAGVRVGLSICEDLWKGEDSGFAQQYVEEGDPVAELARLGIDLLLSPSASPFVLGKGRRQRDLLRRHATRHGVFVASVNQVGGNDELVFDGHSAVYGPDGSLVAAGRGFEEQMLVVEVGGDGATERRGDGGGVAADPLLTAAAEELLFKALRLGVRDYLRKTGFSTAVIGLSGGIDSAVTAAVAAGAVGAGNVTGVAMPGPYSSGASLTDAAELARRLNMPFLTLPIDEPFKAFCHALDAAFTELERSRLGERLPDTAEENVQSRIRGTALMALSNRTGAIVLTTGNKSELAVGYCTLYGDMNGGLAVLSDVSKQQVYALARWINANPHECGCSSPGPIPENTVTRPPSAELAPDQKDQDTLPPYADLDRIVERIIEHRQSPRRVAAETGIDEDVVRRIAGLITAAEYKRKQMATGIKVTSVAFGAGRRMPIAQGWRGV